MSGGAIDLEIYNERKINKNIYSSAKFNTKQKINKNNILSLKALVTNSISTTRSINEEPVSFEDIFINLDSYNVLNKDDYLKSEISSVAALKSTGSNFIPITPSIRYESIHNPTNETSLMNQFYIGILKEPILILINHLIHISSN